MRAAVVLAYRDIGCPHRQAACAYVLEHVWKSYDIHVCDSGQQPFSRAGSFNQGALQSDADVLVFADADVVPEEAAIENAIRHAYVLGTTAYPYREYIRLGATATLVLETEHSQATDMMVRADPRWAEWKQMNSVGGVFVVRRDLYLEAGGCDPRFVGWGFEDVAWSAVSATLLGDHVREDGSLLHLWHPWDPHSGPAEKTGAEREVYAANVSLCDRYTAAIGNAEAIRAVRAA